MIHALLDSKPVHINHEIFKILLFSHGKRHFHSIVFHFENERYNSNRHMLFTLKKQMFLPSVDKPRICRSAAKLTLFDQGQ